MLNVDSFSYMLFYVSDCEVMNSDINTIVDLKSTGVKVAPVFLFYRAINFHRVWLIPKIYLKLNIIPFKHLVVHKIYIHMFKNNLGFLPGLPVSSAKRKLPEETAEEMEGKKHFLLWKKWKK